MEHQPPSWASAHDQSSLTSRVMQAPAHHLGGTFPYAAPELLLGRPCSLSADIYSLGVLLHEIITRLMPQRGQLRHVW